LTGEGKGGGELIEKEKVMRFKILVIDDEPILRESLEVALKASNYEVVTARTGEEGLDRFKKERKK
jgi:CheY-like chemotaxis protein